MLDNRKKIDLAGEALAAAERKAADATLRYGPSPARVCRTSFCPPHLRGEESAKSSLGRRCFKYEPGWIRRTFVVPRACGVPPIPNQCCSMPLHDAARSKCRLGFSSK